ncbi:hypothetical protein ERL80_08385 [Campylobacter jejuni]|nr:hypothetical protein [Campylobacter jejuni]
MMTDLLDEHIALLEQMELHYLEKGDKKMSLKIHSQIIKAVDSLGFWSAVEDGYYSSFKYRFLHFVFKVFRLFLEHNLIPFLGISFLFYKSKKNIPI